MNQSFTRDSRDYYFNRSENVRKHIATQHYHSSFEIYYMKEGRCSYFILDRSYDVVSGDVVLMPKGTIHRTNYDSKPHSRLLINFPEELVSPQILEEARSLGFLYRNKDIVPHVEKLFELIEEEYKRNDSLSPEALRIYTEQLLLLMIRNANNKKQEENSNAIVEHAISYIRENYMTDIRLSTVARMMYVSAEHLSRTFKRETSFGFSEYLTLYRLQRAECMLLKEPGRAICEIAYACGFNDSNYFSYRFKKQYGISPTKARENVGTPEMFIED